MLSFTVQNSQEVCTSTNNCGCAGGMAVSGMGWDGLGIVVGSITYGVKERNFSMHSICNNLAHLCTVFAQTRALSAVPAWLSSKAENRPHQLETFLEKPCALGPDRRVSKTSHGRFSSFMR